MITKEKDPEGFKKRTAALRKAQADYRKKKPMFKGKTK
jgi:hypothetical protein